VGKHNLWNKISRSEGTSVLVFNNVGSEMLRVFESEARSKHSGNRDFATVAAGLGGDGHPVRTRVELESACARAR
jgi:thiamine pyrophosphate-dependent acetolactate synthase large subunit-like protein